MTQDRLCDPALMSTKGTKQRKTTLMKQQTIWLP